MIPAVRKIKSELDGGLLSSFLACCGHLGFDKPVHITDP